MLALPTLLCTLGLHAAPYAARALRPAPNVIMHIEKEEGEQVEQELFDSICDDFQNGVPTGQDESDDLDWEDEPEDEEEEQTSAQERMSRVVDEEEEDVDVDDEVEADDDDAEDDEDDEEEDEEEDDDEGEDTRHIHASYVAGLCCFLSL